LADFRIGCSGWSYRQWIGPFYPSGTKPGDFLKLYSKVFNFAEIDSTFYGIPEQSTVLSWRDSTPTSFLFASKVPQVITHEKMLLDSDKELNSFMSAILNLGSKLGVVLFQFPPLFSFEMGFDRLKAAANELPTDIRFAMEFRHQSWFRDELYSVLQKKHITMVWSEIAVVNTPPFLTSSDVYLRLVGDRSIDERDFGKIRRDRGSEIERWSNRILEEKYNLDHVFSAANNHFAGFAPETANRLLKGLGLEPVDWRAKMNRSGSGKQKTLF
jgi:uncharacterized protein YecE (DUF72 family)